MPAPRGAPLPPRRWPADFPLRATSLSAVVLAVEPTLVVVGLSAVALWAVGLGVGVDSVLAPPCGVVASSVDLAPESSCNLVERFDGNVVATLLGRFRSCAFHSLGVCNAGLKVPLAAMKNGRCARARRRADLGCDNDGSRWDEHVHQLDWSESAPPSRAGGAVQVHCTS